MIGTITPNPSIDQHVFIDSLVKDDRVRAKWIRQAPGGKGLNVARVVSELGGYAVAFAPTGGHAGRMLERLVRESGVRLESVEVPGETRLNVILRDESDGSQTRLSAPGPSTGAAAGEALLERALRYRPWPTSWVLGGSLPPDVPAELYATAILRLKNRGAVCFLDADDLSLAKGVAAGPFLVKPNEAELARLVGRVLPDDDAILDAAREVVARGVQVVAASLGARGALVVTGGEALRVMPPEVSVRSRVGAGDAFLAGFALACSRGESLAGAARFACAAGTAAVMHEGTQLCRRQDVESLLPFVHTRTIAGDPAAPVGHRAPAAMTAMRVHR